MCNQLTTLATQGETRQIWSCEHGTIHLNWEQITLRLHPQAFKQVVRLVEQRVTDLACNKLCAGNCAIISQENGFYKFWYSNSMLLLDSPNFYQLVDLVRQADKRLVQLSRGSDKPQRLKQRYNRWNSTVNSNGFSLN
ncbi:MAG: hypothetical protein AAF485_30120 [Chloroflexota bacterium]